MCGEDDELAVDQRILGVEGCELSVHGQLSCDLVDVTLVLGLSGLGE